MLRGWEWTGMGMLVQGDKLQRDNMCKLLRPAIQCGNHS